MKHPLKTIIATAAVAAPSLLKLRSAHRTSQPPTTPRKRLYKRWRRVWLGAGAEKAENAPAGFYEGALRDIPLPWMGMVVDFCLVADTIESTISSGRKCSTHQDWRRRSVRIRLRSVVGHFDGC